MREPNYIFPFLLSLNANESHIDKMMETIHITTSMSISYIVGVLDYVKVCCPLKVLCFMSITFIIPRTSLDIYLLFLLSIHLCELGVFLMCYIMQSYVVY